MNANKDHPEIENIKNICETSPGTKETKDVCDAVNLKQSHAEDKKASPDQKHNNSLKHSTNSGNHYFSQNKKSKNMEKEVINNSPKRIK